MEPETQAGSSGWMAEEHTSSLTHTNLPALIRQSFCPRSQQCQRAMAVRLLHHSALSRLQSLALIQAARSPPRPRLATHLLRLTSAQILQVAATVATSRSTMGMERRTSWHFRQTRAETLSQNRTRITRQELIQKCYLTIYVRGQKVVWLRSRFSARRRLQ